MTIHGETKMRLKGFRILRQLATIVLLAAASAVAAQSGSTGNGAAQVDTFSLEKLMSRSEQIVLQSAADRYAFYVPLSPRTRVSRATLDLVFTNSISLLEPRSQLRVRVNGKVVGQTLLEAKNPARELRVDLPPGLMTSGYNELEVFVAQHYANQCENPMSPELWTNIDTASSRLTFEYELVSVRESLAELAALIDPLGWNPYRLVIMTPSGNLEASDLALGAGLSEGVAALLKYRPLKVSHAAVLPASSEMRERASGRVALIGNAADNDAILFGTADQIAGYLTDAMAAEIVGPYIGLARHVSDNSRFVLVISGRDTDEIAVAARAFTLAGASLPDAGASWCCAYQRSHHPGSVGKNEAS
jgi:hypothetical protein